MTVLELARAERADFAVLLASLTPEQWEHPTLCVGWRVRDVIGHVIGYDGLGARAVARHVGANRLHLGRINAAVLAEYDTWEPGELLALFRSRLTPRGLTSGFGGALGLTDALIHHQDIRRPLRLPREVPPERLLVALRMALLAPVLGGIVRVRDVRLVADDLDWTFGRGPEVRGPAEALLMMLAGRGAALADLSGPGLDRVSRRVRVPTTP